VQLLLNQVKTLQDQVTQLSSKPQSQEVPVPSMPNPGQMDLKTVMNARLQGLQGIPGYGASGFNGAQGMGGFGASDFSGVQGMSDSFGANSPSVWVSNIPEDFRNTKAIGNIFGNFGNVMKVKFSRKKPDGALVQMQDPSHAIKCCQFLNGVKLPGGKFTVRPSKIEQVIINPHEDSDQAKDFSGGYEHRYRDLNSKFAQTCLQRLGRPTCVLMVASIPEDKMSELKAYIIESGYTVENMEEGKKKATNDETKGEPNKKRTHFAFVELASIEEAVSAVARLHSTMPKSIGEGRFRRLVFSFTTKTSC
jgi:RNA recognition motif-containing protein